MNLSNLSSQRVELCILMKLIFNSVIFNTNIIFKKINLNMFYEIIKTNYWKYNSVSNSYE